MKRIPPSTQMREAVMNQLQARAAAVPAGPAQPLRAFVARAAELILQVGIEEQLAGFLGRAQYERGGGARPGYRNGYGHHTLKTEAGPLALRPPKVRGTAEPFAVQLPAGLTTSTPELRALVTRAYVRGLSDRDVEGLYAEVFGGALSKSTVSRATQSLQADFDAWRKRDLSDLQVVYLFLDGQYHAVRPDTREKEGLLAAYALLEDGRMVLLHLGLGPRERTEAWLAFLHDLTARGLEPPVLLIADGNPGLRKAVKQVLPGVRYQRCQVHKLRNFLAKLPRLAARELKPLVKQIFEAPDHRTALRRGKALLARYRDRYPAAMECLEQDLAECVTCLLFPREHWKRIRTTNLLERTFGESRRRTKVIPRFPGEHACLRLVFATLITASKKWRGVQMTPKILRALDKLRVEAPAPKEQAAA
jgi:transposase-like protein